MITLWKETSQKRSTYYEKHNVLVQEIEKLCMFKNTSYGFKNRAVPVKMCFNNQLTVSTWKTANLDLVTAYWTMNFGLPILIKAAGSKLWQVNIEDFACL